MNIDKIIESYLEEPPAKSSVLIYGSTQDNKVIHIIVGFDDEQLYFVTAYYPNTDKFENVVSLSAPDVMNVDKTKINIADKILEANTADIIMQNYS